MNPQKPHEKVNRDLKTKTVYHYVDERNNIDIKSKEVYKKKNLVIHYPFRRNGQSKYPDLDHIKYVDMPQDLQRGLSNNWRSGYGFTRTISKFIYGLLDKYEIGEIIITPSQPSSINKNSAIINAKDLDSEFPKFSSLLENHNKELTAQAKSSLNKIYPKRFKPAKSNYRADALSRFIRRNGLKASDLSEKDVNTLLQLTKDADQSDLVLNEASVLQTKERIEEFYIEAVIEEFQKLRQQKTATLQLEEKWQKFFKKYNWIFSQLFSAAVLFFEDKAYVGGKTIENREGKVADFIYKNALTDNLSIIEIKTHKTPLIRKGAYRGQDVYALDKELSGAINQVLDQRDNLQKEFYDLNTKSDKEFEVYNPECLVIAGTLKSLSANHKKAFELQRSNSKDVRLITFDEIFIKLKSLEKIITGKND